MCSSVRRILWSQVNHLRHARTGSKPRRAFSCANSWNTNRFLAADVCTGEIMRLRFKACTAEWKAAEYEPYFKKKVLSDCNSWGERSIVLPAGDALVLSGFRNARCSMNGNIFSQKGKERHQRTFDTQTRLGSWIVLRPKNTALIFLLFMCQWLWYKVENVWRHFKLCLCSTDRYLDRQQTSSVFYKTSS